MTNKKAITDYYPYPTFRIGHKEAMEQIQLHWDNFDVCLLVSPTGSGKTALRRTVAYWNGDSMMTTPKNDLIRQELDEFPWTNHLFAKESYPELKQDDYQQDLRNIQRRGHPALLTPHMMIARRAYRSILVADEAHTLIPLNQDLMARRLFRKNVEYPPHIWDRKALEAWLKTANFPDRDKYLQLLTTNDFMIKREKDLLRGKYEDCIKFIPINPPLSPVLASPKTKLILLSATLSHLDVEDLGVGRGSRVLKIEVPSPIPPERRPIIRDYVGALNYRNLEMMAPAIAIKILQISRKYPGKKGIVHATYGLGKLLHNILGNNEMFIFHNQFNAKEKLDEWLDGKEPKIFIASGFEAGLDLKGEGFPYQIIAKINWPSLVDVVISKKTKERPEWFIWQTTKNLLQQCGRIARAEWDFGATYILDSTFERLIADASKFNLIPDYFKEVL